MLVSFAFYGASRLMLQPESEVRSDLTGHASETSQRLGVEGARPGAGGRRLGGGG